MYAEVVWVLVYSGSQVQPQIMLDTDYFPDYPSVSYDYEVILGEQPLLRKAYDAIQLATVITFSSLFRVCFK